MAAVNENTHTVTYTDLATNAEKAQIDALVDELRREDAEKGRETEHSEPESKEPEQAIPTIPQENVRRFVTAILSDRASAEAFLDAVLQNPEFNALLNQKMAETRQASVPGRETPEPAEKGRSVSDKVAAAPTAKQDPDTEKLKQEFDRDYSYLQTLFGFNQKKYDALRADMTARFGTDDPKQFQAMLDAGKLDSSGKLRKRLESSRKIADMKNAVRQTEKAQEKERA